MEFTKEQWENIGLLEGVSEDRKEMVSHAMTLAFNWIDSQPKPEQDIPGYQHEIYPLEAARRVAMSIDLTDEEILEICKEVGPARDKFDFGQFIGYSLDAECEFQFDFCEKKIEELKSKHNDIKI
jgi:hypothetical protein